MVVAGGRIFVLGSGFSASMGLPTLADLFPAVMAEPGRTGEQDHDHIRNALRSLYPHLDPDAPSIGLPPFEEFLSLLHASDGLPMFPQGYWAEKLRASLRLLTDALARRAKEAEGSAILQSFVEQLRDGDVVITFNWDNLVERGLLALRRRVNLLERDSDAVAVLKLHGSLNWVKIPATAALQHPESVATVADNVVRTHDFSYYDVWDVLDSPPLICPPIAGKRPLDDDFFGPIWHEAFNSLVDGESVSFIGYSIPRDDHQARALLSVSWQTRKRRRRHDGLELDRYKLLDPSPEVCGRYAAVIGSDQIYRQARLETEHLPWLFPSVPL